MLSVLPIFAHSRFEMLSARSKQARPKSWPPQCDIKQLLRDPPSAHLSPDVLTYKESSFPTRGGGFSLKLKGALCMVCVGRETEIHLSRSHLFHEN